MNHLDETPTRPHWTEVHKVIQYAGGRYETIVADLPDSLNPASRELLIQANGILIVTTMELSAMKLAARRLQQLREAGTDIGKVSLVLNRWHRHNLNRDDTEKLLAVKVAGVVPNDYRSFQAALQVAGFVNPATPAGRAIENLARHLAGVDPIPEEGNRLLRFLVQK
jgi:pilus assembly protein CpaE